jgi:hypothetical protein
MKLLISTPQGRMLLSGIAVVWLLLLGFDGFSQSAVEISRVKKAFGGVWVDAKSTRHLQISVETDGTVTINDWTSKSQQQESGDAYRAFIKNAKLTMPADPQHHAPYSEMVISDQRLIYLTAIDAPKGKRNFQKQFFARISH